MVSMSAGLRQRAMTALGIWVMTAVPIPAQAAETPDLDVPYVPTHQRAVEEMLKLAKVTADDYVIDLGCGDGRIVVMAAKKHKAHGLGVDLDPKRVRESKKNASKAGVSDLVEFRKEDVMKTDIRRASVVTLFLLEEVNVLLRPRLFSQLKPGTRVVSNSFTMRDWKPDKEVRHSKAYSNVLYFWTIPAPVGGTWAWTTNLAGKEIANSMVLGQEFQAVQGKVACPEGVEAPITGASLAGKELQFTATVRTGKENVTVAYRGTVSDNTITGTQEWRGGAHAGTYPWTARHKPADLIGQWQVRTPLHPEYDGTLHIRGGAGGPTAAYVLDNGDGKEVPLSGFYVWGSSIRFEIPLDEGTMAFSGSLGGDTGKGTAAVEQLEKRAPWSAKRLARER